MKVHSGNTWQSRATWIGQYTEYLEISDNFYAGTSGAVFVEVKPQNNISDERLRYIVFERNFLEGSTGNAGGPGRLFLTSAANETIRNNVFYVMPNDTTPPFIGAQVAQLGIEPVPTAVEVYNNTCYYRTTVGSCVGFQGGTGCCVAAAGNSWAYNNLLYNNGQSSAAVVNSGAGNTVSNNTTNSAANPLLINTSGTFSAISDFQPTQNYTGGAEVPVWYDALGAAWSPTWSLGALKPQAKSAARDTVHR
jgi:hypothetical protein